MCTATLARQGHTLSLGPERSRRSSGVSRAAQTRGLAIQAASRAAAPPRGGHLLSMPPLSTPSSGVSSPKALPRTACHSSAGSSAATPCASLSQPQTASRPGGTAPASEAYCRAHRRRLPMVSSAWTSIHSGSAEGSPSAVAVRVDTSGGSSSTGSPGSSALRATQCVPNAGEYCTAKALLLAVDRGSLSNTHWVRPSGVVSRPTRSMDVRVRVRVRWPRQREKFGRQRIGRDLGLG